MLIHGNPQRLIIQGKDFFLKIIPHQRECRCFPAKNLFRNLLWHRHFILGRCAPGLQHRPAVLPPQNFLDGGLSSHHVAAAVRKPSGIRRITVYKGPPAQVYHVPLSSRSFHQIPVPAFLQKYIFIMSAGKDGKGFVFLPLLSVIFFQHLIRPPDVPGAKDGLSMALPGSGVRREQAVPSLMCGPSRKIFSPR